MKKIFFVFCLLAASSLSMAMDIITNGLKLGLDEVSHTASVNGFEGGINIVSIPESVVHDGIMFPVTFINNSAFSGCSITSITIPNSVTTIGEEAFSGCSNLSNITIPNSVNIIGDGTFSGCRNITTVTITILNSTSDIDYIIDLFEECNNLANVNIIIEIFMPLQAQA